MRNTRRTFKIVHPDQFETDRERPNTVLHSPTLARSVTGKTEVKAAIDLANEVQSESSYTSIIATPGLLIELFDRNADGYPRRHVNPKDQRRRL
jgi:hypothetical protein